MEEYEIRSLKSPVDIFEASSGAASSWKSPYLNQVVADIPLTAFLQRLFFALIVAVLHKNSQRIIIPSLSSVVWSLLCCSEHLVLT